MPVGVLRTPRRAARAACVALLALLALLPFADGIAAAHAPPHLDGSRKADAWREAVDDLGHRYEFASPPRRVVSLSPNLTEILFAIACDSLEIAGVTRFCDHPPAARAVAQVGGIVDPSLEAVLLCEPDLVLATRGNPLEFMGSLIDLGVPVYAVEGQGDLEYIPRLAGRIGRLVGCAEEAERLERDLTGKLRAVEEVLAGLPPEARPRVYFGEIEGALWTAGPGSHVDGLIRAAGGANVAAGAPSAWCPLSLEAIVTGDPQVYFGTFAGEDTPERRAAALAKVRAFLEGHEAWRQTSLGRSPRLFLVQEDRILRPGPRVFDVLVEFARFLHPERFAGGEE